MLSLSLTKPAAPPRPLVALTVISVALTLLAVVWSLVDPRLFQGAPVWSKPLKFALSFGVLFGTMAAVDARLTAGWRDGRLLRTVAWVMAAAMLSEMAYMGVQAAKVEASHFNDSTPFHQMAYAAMGIGAVSLVMGIAIMGFVALRDRGADFGPGLRRGIGIGFIASCLLTLITAGTMSSMSGHFIGVPGPGAATIPLMGWSAAVGDLRPAHFVALHAMQALPLFGIWLDRTGRSTALMTPVTLGYVALVMAMYGQAMMGLPIIRL